MEKIISVNQARKSFGDTTALKSLSFEVNRGEIFGFLGPSGAGKTTTIKLLTRQLVPDEGQIEVFFHPVDTLSREDDARIGVLTDNSGVYDRLTVLENLSLFATLRNVDHSVVLRTLEEVGLAGDKKKIAKNLSRGMKQRLMLAQAILHHPQLLFLDEPTASLDPGTSADIHALLRGLNKEGTTIFLTTHNMEEADKLCSRVAFLNNGEIVEEGPPQELKLKYSHGLIRADLEGGIMVEEEKTAEGLMRIAQLAKNKRVLQIHSQEPNLEEIFLKVTGRKLA
ncbi:MAG: ABC transporter ATP-binding protein [Oscillospiraceae bacterium]